MMDSELILESENYEKKFENLSNKGNQIEAYHFNGLMGTVEINKVMQTTQKLAEMMDLSQKDCGIIYKTYVKITRMIRDNQNGFVYFPAKFKITLLYAFRVDQHLRSRYILEYKDLMRLLHNLGFTTNSHIQNRALQLIDFDYRKYRYNIDDYAVLYWKILVSSELILPYLDKLGMKAREFIKILRLIFHETNNKYQPDPSVIYSKSKFSYILNLFILCFELIDQNRNLEKSKIDSSKEPTSKTIIETELRSTIARVIYENKMLKTTLILIEHRFRNDNKFDELRRELCIDKELTSKIYTEINHTNDR